MGTIQYPDWAGEERINCLVYPNGPAKDEIHRWSNLNNCKKTTVVSICKKKMGVLARQEEENGHTKGAVSIRVAVRLPHRQTSGLRICPSRFRLKFGVEKREFFFFFFFIVFDVFVWFLKFFFSFLTRQSGFKLWGAPSCACPDRARYSKTPLSECSGNRQLTRLAHDKHLCQSVVLSISSLKIISKIAGGTKKCWVWVADAPLCWREIVVASGR